MPAVDRAQIISTAANLGGLGLGGLIAGALAQWVGHALTLPFLALVGALLIGLVAIALAPETRMAASPRPRYRPQRVSVPPRSRGRFFAAATAAAITFAIFGLITSLAPSFLAGTLHEPSHALAGAVSFALFATAALAQTLTGSRAPHQLLAAAIPALLVGIGLLTLAVWVPSPSFGIFLAGDLVAGVGAGLMFKGAIETVTEISLPERRAEAVAGFFLAAYLGLAGPVIGLGVLTQIASTRVSLLVFSGLLALGIFAATPPLLGGPGRRHFRTPATSLPLKRSHHADNATQDHTARPDRPRDHPRRVRRVGDRRRRLGVRLGTPAGRAVDRSDPARARARGQLDRHRRRVRLRSFRAGRRAGAAGSGRTPVRVHQGVAAGRSGPPGRPQPQARFDPARGARQPGAAGIDAIDLYQIHWPIPDEDIEEGWSAFAELKEQGLVRHIGVSNFDVEQLRRIQQIAPVETLQPQYSLIERDIEREILPFAERVGSA